MAHRRGGRGGPGIPLLAGKGREASDEQRDAQRGAAAFAALGVRAGAAARRGRAGLVFLGVRQGWAHVHTSAPRPLPGSNVTVTGQDLVPAASALAIAGLATLAAVIATRGLARRLAGGLLMLFGAGAAASALWPISDPAAIRAAASSAGLNGLAGSGTGAGSVTAGGSGGTGGTAPISGFLASVAMTGTAWRGLAVAGAALLVAAGLLTIWRSGPWPVMSSRYERPPRPAGPGSPVPASPCRPGRPPAARTRNPVLARRARCPCPRPCPRPRGMDGHSVPPTSVRRPSGSRSAAARIPPATQSPRTATRPSSAWPPNCTHASGSCSLRSARRPRAHRFRRCDEQSTADGQRPLHGR